MLTRINPADLIFRAIIFPSILIAALACGLAGCAESQSTPDESPEQKGVRAGGPSDQAVTFTDITAAAGLDGFRHTTGGFGERWMPEIVGAGVGVLDYDGDGWPDLLLVRGGAFPGRTEPSGPALALYRNNGDGTFTNRTAEAGLEAIKTYGYGLGAADYDNDGDVDFLLTTLHENLLFRNDGGTFTEVGRAAGVQDEAVWSSAVVFFDADRDGWLDLYVGNYVDWSPEKDLRCVFEGEKVFCTPEAYEGIPSSFYHNNGDGTFTNHTAEAGFLPAPGKSFAAAELDFNKDGWPDLVVANDTQPDLLYRNDGDGTFTEIGTAAGVAYDENGIARAGMGLDVGVVDDTGEETVFIGNFSEEMIGVYRHLRNGLFMDRAAVSKIGHPSLKTLTFGLLLFDPDLDGRLDLFAANGHVQTHIEKIQAGVTFRQPPQLFMNRGDATFEERGTAFGDVFTTPMVARGAAYADLDRDGDQDLVITENGGPVHVWRNDHPNAQVLRVRVQGTEGNRDGIGSRLVAVVGSRRMERRVRTGASFLSQSEKTATFGLGEAARVDTLTVYWPKGRVETFTDLAAGQEVRIVEGSGRVESLFEFNPEL